MSHAMSGLITSVMAQAATTHHAIHVIQRQWKRAVGASLAATSRPVSLRRGVLSVEADDPGTAYGLSLQKPRVLERFKRASVSDLVIRAGGRRKAGTA